MRGKISPFVIVLLSLLFAPGLVVSSSAQGWESEYEGVMLQGFYWDSFEDSKWINLTDQVDELSAYFDLIWIPNSSSSGYYSMGYTPKYWFKHDSSFGTEAELRRMINKFKEKGTGFIADVVINHRDGVSNWCDFPAETDHHGVTWQLGLDAICSNDEMAYQSGQPTPTGARDEGENFDGARDLDHTNSYVQSAVKAYLDFLLNDLGYEGFRYDMVKGFAAYYVGLYNDAAKPTYSVGEYYDGNYDLVTGWIDGTIRNNKIQSGAFDFPLKFAMNGAFSYPSDFTKLAWWRGDLNANQPAGLIHMDGFRRFAVTFIDNHDTFRDGGTAFGNDYYLMAAHAFMLCSPGTPCVFLKHWMKHKSDIKRLIDIRNSVGIHNQSTVEVWEATTGHYAAKVYGKNGNLFIKVGYDDYSPSDYSSSDIVASGDGYCIWTKTAISSAEKNIVPANDKNGFSVYVEKSSLPTSWSKLYCYSWDDDKVHLTSTFPGERMTKVVTINGVEYYKYSFGSSITLANIVLSNGNGSQTVDLKGLTGDTFYRIDPATSGKHTATLLDVSGVERGEPITIYLDKSSLPAGWSDVKLYAWDKSSTLLAGSWPGSAMESTQVIEGATYYTYTFPDDVTLLNLILNNGTAQTCDVKGVEESTILRITDLIDGKYETEQTPYEQGVASITVYVEKSSVSSWPAVYYYAWDTDNKPIGNTWPGKKITTTTFLGGDEYYVYTYPTGISELNVIINNGQGGQTADITGVDSDLYLALHSNFSYDKLPQPIKIYLYTGGEWERVYYYAWDENETELLGAWPGKLVEETMLNAYGMEYYSHTFSPRTSAFNISFSDGTERTVDMAHVTGTTYYRLGSKEGGYYTLQTGNIPTKVIDIEDAASDDECRVYPNPVADRLCIHSSQPVVNVAVYDLQGMLLCRAQGEVIDVNHLARGMYIYHVELAGGATQRGKFVKR